MTDGGAGGAGADELPVAFHVEFVAAVHGPTFAPMFTVPDAEEPDANVPLTARPARSKLNARLAMATLREGIDNMVVAGHASPTVNWVTTSAPLTMNVIGLPCPVVPLQSP